MHVYYYYTGVLLCIYYIWHNFQYALYLYTYTCILLLKYEACIHGRFEPARYNFKLGKHASTYT